MASNSSRRKTERRAKSFCIAGGSDEGAPIRLDREPGAQSVLSRPRHRQS
jgi:hypothetical protein